MPLTYSSFLPEVDTDAGILATCLVKQSKNKFHFVFESPSTTFVFESPSTTFVSYIDVTKVKRSPSGIMFCEEKEQHCSRKCFLKISEIIGFLRIALIELEETSPGKLEVKARNQWLMKLDYGNTEEFKFIGYVPRFFGPYEIFGPQTLLWHLRDTDLSVEYEPVPYEPGH